MTLSVRYLLLFLIFLSFPFSLLHAGLGVQFGPRPPINMQALSVEAFEPGQLRIQFKKEAGEDLLHNPPTLKNNRVVFGIKQLDDLSSEKSFLLAQKTFSGPAIKAEFDYRHKAWGLHLWYDIHFDSDTDVRAIIEQLKAVPEIEFAEPVYRKQLVGDGHFEWDASTFMNREELEEWLADDPQLANQWHYHNTGQTGGTPGADIDLVSAWQIEKGNPDVVVAIIDDGIQFDHPDLAANMWEGIGFNFVDNNPNIVPGDHGTHVGGTVAAVTNNGQGVSGVAGGSGEGDGVRLMSAQVFRGNTSGGFPSSFIWAADNGAAISQNSWGYTAAGVFEQAVLTAIDYFNVNGGGEVMDGGITIFAAGNSDADGEWYPGFYTEVFSVAATSHTDQKAWYSNYGHWIDVSAPGGETNMVNNRGVLSTVTNSGYNFFQGTSMACPHVSGIAALVLSYKPGELTNDQLKEILIASTDFHYDVNPAFVGKLGSGRSNALKALTEADNFTAGLINPAGFSAMATGVDEISLIWLKNPANHQVLLAWSHDGVFGVPQSLYQAGDTLDGGGSILFSGSGTEFIHDELVSNSGFFYKIWSVSPDGEYSSGRITFGRTLCGIFSPMELPGLASGELPDCWQIVNNGGGRQWQIGQFNGGLNIDENYAFTGNSLAGAKNTDLITSTLDFSGFENVSVSFNHFFRTTFLGGSAATFSYSTDNGLSWSTVNTWTQSTANPQQFSIDLPQIAGETMVQFKWNMAVDLLGFFWAVGHIQINLEPVEAPSIAFHPEQLQTTIKAGETLDTLMFISNQGSMELTITNIFIDWGDGPQDFVTLTWDEDILITPGLSAEIPLRFHTVDLDDETYTAILSVVSDDPVQPVVELLLELTVLPGDGPLANFAASHDVIFPGDVIAFTDLSVGDNIIQWNWELPGGDPSSSQEQNPVVSYNNPGVFDVTLMVANRWGVDSTVVSGLVVVQDNTLVDHFHKETIFNIAPNPSDGQFTVFFTSDAKGIISVINSHGVVVSSKPLTSGSSLNFNLTNRPSGLYILEFSPYNSPAERSRLIIR